MTPGTKRGYKLTYKKKPQTTDSYISRKGQAKILLCEACNDVYMNKRWYHDNNLSEQAAQNPETVKVICPADQKIRDDFPGGIVTLRGSYVRSHKDALLQLVKNEEERARGLNPLERIISIKEHGNGEVVITTTNEKMAQRIGRAINKAFHGEVSYRWSHDTKLVRVDWKREEDKSKVE
ncbi:MAG: BCAM0308 family protein [Nitrospirota bacterium]